MAESHSTSLFLAGADVISLRKCDSTPATTVTSSSQSQRQKPQSSDRLQLVWRNIIAFLFLHSITVYVIFFRTNRVKGYTWLLTIFYSVFGGFGVTAGAHRLWAHKCYKAKWPLRVMLMLFQTMAFQNHIYEWVRDHRVHHKFVDTDADPHNSKRGFFFSHIGWLMVRKNPAVQEKGKTVDMSDIEIDPIVRWQRKHYLWFVMTMTFIVPTLIPYLWWSERLSTAFYMAICRYTLSLNGTWLVNSAAHIWGMKPYDKSLSSTENTAVAIAALGEGFHNYHHAFPWDYKAAELGAYGINWSTGFIDLFAKIGWAYDLKMATPEIVKKRILRTGDGSHTMTENQTDDVATTDVWGWDDIDLSSEEKQLVRILHKKEGE